MQDQIKSLRAEISKTLLSAEAAQTVEERTALVIRAKNLALITGCLEEYRLKKMLSMGRSV